jgi:hypothetical protein
MVLTVSLLFQDGNVDIEELLLLLPLSLTVILTLVDLRGLSEKRWFAAVLSVDALLLVLISWAEHSSGIIPHFPQVWALGGIVGGLALLVSGVFRVVRPTKTSHFPMQAK